MGCEPEKKRREILVGHSDTHTGHLAGTEGGSATNGYGRSDDVVGNGGTSAVQSNGGSYNSAKRN